MRGLLEPTIGKFKDKRGSWSVHIDLTSDGAIVFHTKRQQSQNAAPDGTPDFEFDWVLQIPLINSGKQVDTDGLTISLTGLVCASHVSKEQENTISDCLDQNKKIE